MSAPTTERWDIVPITQLHEHPGNPWHGRRDVDELALSIKELGVLQPLLVRPRPKGKGFEVVCGNRRLRASRLVADLDVVPVIVRELDDRQVLEAQIAENGQREDVHPIEECAAYELLMSAHGYSADDIAAKTGRSRSYVYGRLKYSSLTPECREAFLAGKVSPSVALYLARIPNAALQNQALADVGESDGEDALSARAALDCIRREYMLALADAPFDTADAELVSEAGACTTCPKRTGAQPELFADVESADVCTDTTCYAAKRTAHGERLVQLHKARGGKVLSKKASAEVFPYWNTTPDRAYVDMDVVPSRYDLAKPTKKSWDKLLGAAAEDHVILARDKEGTVRRLMPEPVATRLLKEQHPKLVREPEKKPAVSPAEKRKQEKERQREKLKAATYDAVLVDLVEQVTGAEHGADTWRLVLRAILRQGSSVRQAAERVCKRRGLEVPKGTRADDYLEAELSQMAEPDLIALALELIVRHAMIWAYTRDVLEDQASVAYAVCDLFEVPVTEIRERIKVELEGGAVKPVKRPAKEKKAEEPTPAATPEPQHSLRYAERAKSTVAHLVSPRDLGRSVCGTSLKTWKLFSVQNSKLTLCGNCERMRASAEVEAANRAANAAKPKAPSKRTKKGAKK